MDGPRGSPGAGMPEVLQCVVTFADGTRCPDVVDVRAPLPLCARHLLEAYDWVASGVGVLDLLPSPCRACGSRLGVRYPSGWICADCEWRVGEIPDEEWAAPGVEVVYYLRYHDQIKIGTSANPRLRFASIPHDEVLAFERGGRRLEQRRHAQFADHRFPGTEWFEVHDALQEHIAQIAAGVDDPWAEYGRWVSRRLALGGA
jgi:Meiotically up-regulated gene 113